MMAKKEKDTTVHDDGSERWHICHNLKVNKLDQHYKLKKVWEKTPKPAQEDRVESMTKSNK